MTTGGPTADRGNQLTDDKMFCFQCEQTAGCTGCVGSAGVCGKDRVEAAAQDELTGALVALARAMEGRERDESVDELVLEGLFTCVTNVSFDKTSTESLRDKAMEIARAFDQDAVAFDMGKLWSAQEDVRSLKSLILFGVRGLAAYAHHAWVLGYRDESVLSFCHEALRAIGEEEWGAEELLPVVLKAGKANFAAMALLGRANTERFGDPAPTEVGLGIEAGPFIVVTGHDLGDLAQLLEQCEGRGVNVYTHGEMLPAHAYPGLARFECLKGNFGTAWQNQRVEFDGIPAPILFTTNCLMPPKGSYADRVFTTGNVEFPDVPHISATDEGEKDFSAVIDRALELGGYESFRPQTGVNGGSKVTTGFGHKAVLSVTEEVVSAVKSGALKHIFLVGGCDGARAGRNYYTDFVAKAPEDTLVLTLACGKYRFNDMDLGTVGGLPRLLDMGQCNDAYSALIVASALAEVFECGVNDLPLTLVLSWYEQKAVAILLTLLDLGIKGIYLGPTLPAFVSPGVLDILVEAYGIRPISTPEEDLSAILGE